MRAIAALPFLLPAVMFYGVFVVYPMVTSIQLSFYDWDGLSPQSRFVGLDNYVAVLTRDPVFWTAVRNSIIWVVLSIIVPTTVGLALALALNQKLFGRAAFRTIFYIPAVLASIAVATMWRWMYNPTFGVVNSVMEGVGLGDLTQPWLGSTTLALLSVFVASIWQIAGVNMVLFLAGLQGVQRDLLDSARVDGAGARQLFRYVTVPALRPTFFIVIVLTIINSLKVFDLIVGMTGGGPAQSTQVLALWSYTESFGNHNFGQGNAIATILLGLSLVIVVPYLWWTLRGDRP